MFFEWLFRSTGLGTVLLMLEAGTISDDDEILYLLQHRAAHLRYFDAVRRRLPSGSQKLHSQRILLLYFSVAGSDMLGAEWVNGDSGWNTDKEDLLNELKLCYNSHTGGFHPEIVEDYVTSATLAMTHCALHALNTCGLLPRAMADWLSIDHVISFILSCQVNHERHPLGAAYCGAFKVAPDIAETDLRFTYSALVSLALLCAPNRLADVPSLQGVLKVAVEFIWRCWDVHEGGFGAVPGTESHGGMTFCAVASLALAGTLSSITRSRRHLLLRYCTARVSQGPVEHDSVGCIGMLRAILCYQGRPQKDCDTCYAHWIGSALSILHPHDVSLVDPLPVVRFINECADSKHGGVRKCIGFSVDPVHSCLGISGLLQHICCTNVPFVRPPHPVYGCSWATVEKTGLPSLVGC